MWLNFLCKIGSILFCYSFFVYMILNEFFFVLAIRLSYQNVHWLEVRSIKFIFMSFYVCKSSFVIDSILVLKSSSLFLLWSAVDKMKTKEFLRSIFWTFCPGRDKDTSVETDAFFSLWHLINKTNNSKNAVWQKNLKKKFLYNISFYSIFCFAIVYYCFKIHYL